MRDFRGHGPNPPPVRWPDGKALALSFVVNFEEGAEFSIADGDDHNEAVYEVIDRQATVDPCIDSHFEFGTRVGWWRLADLFQRGDRAAHWRECDCHPEQGVWPVKPDPTGWRNRISGV